MLQSIGHKESDTTGQSDTTEQDIRTIRNRKRYKVNRLTTSMTQRRSSYQDMLPDTVQSTLHGLSDLNIVRTLKRCSI